MSIVPHRRLGDLIEEVSDRNHSLQCTNVYSVTNSQGFVPSEDYFNKKVFSKDLSNYKLVRHGMFAYNPSRINVGSIAWLRDMPCVAVSPLYVIFRIKGADVLPAWIAYFLRSDIGRAQIRGLTSGSVRDSLKYSALERIEIPIAPIEDQQRILANLATLDKSIRLCEILLEKMDELVKSQFVELFGDVKYNSKQWASIKLDHIAEVGSSKRVFAEELQPVGIPFYRGTEIGALAEGKNITPELHITEDHYIQLCRASGTPQRGDLLMPSICDDGRIWLVDTDEPFYFKDGRVLWVHLTNKGFNNIFLQYVMKSKITTDYEHIASGTTFKELKIFSLKSLDIIQPPLALQNEFAAFVEQTDKSKLVLRQLLEKQCTLKAALMQEYFS